MNGAYCGALGYADDIISSCPSRRGLNRLLYIYIPFICSNITFNTKKTMCMKYGKPVKDSDKITLDQVQLQYFETVRHLGNSFNTDNNCTSDINYTCSSFIGYFKGECSVFKKKIIMDENDVLSEYNKIPLGHNRTNDAVYSKIYFKVGICPAH